MIEITTDPYRNIPVSNLADALSRADHRGRSQVGKFTHAWNCTWEADDFPPDSVFWKRQANASLDHLRKLLTDSYGYWAELVWPATSIEMLTWRTIRDMAEAAIDAYERKHERDIMQLAEAAHEWLKEKTQ